MFSQKFLIGGLFLLLLLLQARLWLGDGSLEARAELQRALQSQADANARLEVRNEVVERDLRAFEETPERAVESRAREDLGLIKDGETFYLIVDEED